MDEQRKAPPKRGLLVAAALVVLALAAGLALDLANHGLAWRVMWSLTGEEAPVSQMLGMIDWLGSFTREPPQTAPDVAIKHVGINPYGINTFLEQEVEPAKREQQVRMIAEAGFHWIRQEIPWQDIEIHARGDFQDKRNESSIGIIDAWAKYDHIVDLVEQYGLELQARIDKPPAWTHAIPDTLGFTPPDNWDDYINFLTVFAERYKGRIHYYQIWNEPNIYPEWGDNPVNPEEYTAVLCRAFAALKAVDPNNVVISAALSPTLALTGRDLNEFIFLQRMYDAGAKGCFDIMATQGYGFFSGPTDQRMRPTMSGFARSLYLRDVMVRNGDAETPIWISEAAWNPVDSPEVPDMPLKEQFGSVTREQAARYMPLAYDRALREWPWVGVINYWFFKRPSEDDRNQPYYYFRMVEPDFTPLPVYDTMKQYIASTPPTLYAGVHQADDWAFQPDAEGKLIAMSTAYSGRALQAREVTFTYAGTGISLRWIGLMSNKLKISVDSAEPVTSFAPALSALEIEVTPLLWTQTPVEESLVAQTHTVRLSAETPFLLGSVTVYDSTRAHLTPIIAGGVALGLLALGGIGWVLWNKDVAVKHRPPDAQSIRLLTSSRLKAAQDFSPLVRNSFRRGHWVYSQRLRVSGTLTVIVLILLLAAGLRLHLLGAQSFWNDEGSSYVQATRGFLDIAANAGRDIHPPGYYWLLAGWRLLAGTSEFALRSLSVFASLLSIAFACALGRRLFGWGAALAAALLIALNTFSIYYAQEARMYALLALWSAAGMWALAGFLRRPSPRWALLLALFNAAGLWTQYAYPFVMLAQGVVTVVWLITGLRRGGFWTGILPSPSRGERAGMRGLFLYIAANLLTLVLYLPWLATALHQVTAWPNTGDATPFDQALSTILLWLTLGSTSPGAPLAIPGLLLLFGLLVFRRRTIWQVALPVAWAVVPVGLFLALGLFRPDNVKLLLPAQIGMALWIGRGASVLWTLKPGYGGRRDFAVWLGRIVPPATALLSVVWLALAAWDGVPALYTDPAFQRPDYRAIVQTIEANARPGDAVILDAPNQEEVFRYYYGGEAAIYPLPEGLGGDDEATASATFDVVRAHPRIFAVFWGEAERDPQRVVETMLSRWAFEIDSQWYGDARLARYVAPDSAIMMRGSGVRFGDHITLVGYGIGHEVLRRGDALQVALDWRTDEPLTRRYKVFLQLLDADGVLAAQRDSEPGGGLALTTTWTPGQEVRDGHALLIDLPPGDYQLILGLYDLDDPSARLPVSAGGDSLLLATITVSNG